MSEDTRAALYRYYDEHGLLLYVGITERGMRRNVEHNRKAEWWPLVASQEVDHLATRDEALAAEKEAIQLLRPPFNRQHNPNHAARRADYFEAREALDLTTDMGDLFKMAGSVKCRIPLRLVDAHADGSVRWGCAPAMVALARHVTVGAKRCSVFDTNGQACGQVVTADGAGLEIVFGASVAKDKVLSREIESAELRIRCNSKPVQLSARVVHLTGVA